MAPARNNSRKLLVEGATELRTIPELIEAQDGIDWEFPGDTGRRQHLVEIEDMGGSESLLNPVKLSVRLKDPTTRYLGLIVDADSDAEAVWHRLRGHCLDWFPDLPEDLPANGVIASNDRGLRLGVWIMPDNRSRGMLETFLRFLVPDYDGNQLWNFVQQSCEKASRVGAPFKELHRDKAHIHTWLAWQNEPGQQLHSAVQQRLLNPKSDGAVSFVNWFRQFYEI